MRRKPLCLAFLAAFALSVVLGQQAFVRLAPYLPELSAPGPSTSPDSSNQPPIPSGAPSDLIVPSISDLITGPVTEEPTSEHPPVEDSTLDNPVAEDTHPENPSPEEPVSDNLPPEESIPIPTDDFFVVVTNPREVALLAPIEVPRTGDPANMDAPNATIAESGFGAGNNLPSDQTPTADIFSSTISANLATDLVATPAPASNFFLTLLYLGAVLMIFLIIYSLLAHFFR